MNKDRHTYEPQDDDFHKDDYIERMRDRADYLRDQRKDREIDAAIEVYERRKILHNQTHMNTATIDDTTALILRGQGYELTIAPEAEQRKSALLSSASEILAVTSNDESATAQFVSRKLAAMRIEVEKSRKLVKEPVNRIGKLIDETAKNFMVAIEADEKRINRLVGDHASEVARIKQEKLSEEHRLFEEARLAREAAEAAAAAAEESGKIGCIVAAKLAETARQEALAARMEASAEVAETKIAQGVRFAWDFEVTDMNLLADTQPAFVEITARRAVILAWIKALDDGEIEDVDLHCIAAGIRAFKRPVVSSR